MTSMKRSFLFLAIASCSFNIWALDTYIFFAHYPDTPKSQRHSYTIKPGGASKGMYGVYNPGVAHLSKDVADVNLRYNCPSAYVRVHWKSTLRQSYQDFIVTQDDDPSVKATFRWYKPFRYMPYVTIFSNPDHLIYRKIEFLWWSGCKKPYKDNILNDALLYIN